MSTTEWESYALCYRLKTKRQKKRAQKKDQDKQLIRLHNELQRLGQEEKNLGYKELDPPIQRGWKRFFALRPDVERSKDGAFFQALLEKINTEQFSHRKDFKRRQKRKGKKVRVERVQTLCEFYECDFIRSKLTEKEKLYFTETWHFVSKDKIMKKYVFTEPWRYVLTVKPNLITKIKVIDPLLLQQEAEIDNFIEGRMLRPRLIKLLRGSYKDAYWKHSVKEKYRELLKPNSIKKQMEEHLQQHEQY